MESKPCAKCGETLSLDNFSTNSKAKDGKHSWCRSCVNKDKREKQPIYRETQKEYTKVNREKISEYRKEYLSREETKKLKAVWDKTYREKHSEVLKEKRREYYYRDHELTKERKRKNYERNREMDIIRAYQRLYKIRSLTPPDADRTKIKEVYKLARKLTQETGIKYEVDHIVPISKGGLHHEDNLQVLPWIENRKKGNKIIETISQESP